MSGDSDIDDIDNLLLDDNDKVSDTENDDGSPSPNRRKKAKKPVDTISFDEANEQIQRIVESLPSRDDNVDETEPNGIPRIPKRGRRKARTTIKLKSNDWNKVCAALQKKAFKDGLPDDVLDKIWSILSHSEYTLSDRHTSILLLSMIPTNDRIPGEMIHEIVSKIRSFQPLSKLATLKYLTGLYDYNLCEKETLAEYDSYCRIFFAGRTNALIPWLCALIKRISTSALVSRSMVNDLIDLAHKPTVSPAALKAILDLLRFFKNLHPGFVPQRIHNVPVGESKKIEFDAAFRDGLFRAKRRFLGMEFELDEEESSVEMETIQTNVSKIGTFLNKLNDQCFPEFRLHRENDPELDDYSALLRLGKYDQMRCALKTTESLVFIVRDHEVFECFSNFISLILRHKFWRYDAVDNRRYKFILRRIWEVTVLGRKAVPSVVDWILDFIRTWNGHLFKREIYQLISWLPPTQFSGKDGYVYVLRKLETFFLYGEPEDRLQIWLTLRKLGLDWMIELGAAIEEEKMEDVEELINTVEFLLNFLDSLVGQLASMRGHTDVNFLVNCCDTYIELNRSMSLIGRPPFYVYPPLHLWVMVVLSRSLLVLDSFCALLCQAQPRQTLPHLKKTVRQQKFHQWSNDTLQDVYRYFLSLEHTENPVLLPVFRVEIDTLTEVVDVEMDNSTGELTEFGTKCQNKYDVIYHDLKTFSAFAIKTFDPILIEVNQRGGNFRSSIDDEKAERIAPNILKWLSVLQAVRSEKGRKTTIHVVGN